MSDTDAVLIERRDPGVLLVTFDRPETMNAFSSEMSAAFTGALRGADTDDSIRVVVVTGSGRAFCAGADFSKGSGAFAAPTRETFSSDPLDSFHPWDCRKPVIAAINGHAVGIGMTMTLQCDIRIVAEDAKLGIVQNRRGVLPDARAHWTLPRLVGHSRATELLLTGRMFRGTDAAEWGLATEALPADDVLPRALELAAEIATHTAPVSVGVSKRLLWRSTPSPDEINELERDLHLHLMGTADAKEGVQAFMETRDPEWSLSPTEDWPTWLDER
ncbi:MAG: enoyl-CoA hydratase-related protein [Actinomycetota bacterium]